MKVTSKEYQAFVLDDLARCGELSRPMPAGQLKQLLTRKASIDKLHPNPGDEFCNPEIGPNFEIINDYFEAYRRKLLIPSEKLAEPIMVTKLSTGGYRIINGHHRWYAAKKAGIEKLPVRVVNIVTEDDVVARLSESRRTKCASFDLDEVLLTDGSVVPADRNLHILSRIMYRRTLRKSAADLVSKLQADGFDVWVYTGTYDSAQRIQWLFRLHHARVDGIINGVNGGSGQKKRSRYEFRDQFANKYRVITNIDNDGIIRIDTRTKTYDTTAIISNAENWAAAAYGVIDGLKGDT